MIGAYTATEHFAYPGWRLTVPGGPAGGHYKGFTHTQAAGTDLLPQDQYEQDREDGMSSHDPVHASPRNPRGVYRSSAEVPPRPNASGSAMTYRGFQTQRHAGTSVAPGSFPAQFEETDEDAFLAQHHPALAGLDAFTPLRPGTVPTPISQLVRGGVYSSGGPVWPGPPRLWNWGYPDAPPEAPPDSGATSTVRQPPALPYPLPPSPRIIEYVAPPVSPRPAPVVATHDVVPDGHGNYIDVSTGDTVSASVLEQNPATGQVTAAPGASSGFMSWLQENTIFSALPNWGVLAGGLLAASMLMGKRR
jgi:hypothetical protein